MTNYSCHYLSVTSYSIAKLNSCKLQVHHVAPMALIKITLVFFLETRCPRGLKSLTWETCNLHKIIKKNCWLYGFWSVVH